MKCVECGKEFKFVGNNSVTVKSKVENGYVEFDIVNVPYYSCESCGYECDGTDVLHTAEITLGMFADHNNVENGQVVDYYEVVNWIAFLLHFMADKVSHLEEAVEILEAKNGKAYSEDEIKHIIDLDE